MSGECVGQETEFGVDKSKKEVVVKGHVYPGVLERGYGCSEDVCALDGTHQHADVLEAPTGGVGTLVPGGSMVRKLDVKIAERNPSINAPAHGRGVTRVGRDGVRGGTGDSLHYWRTRTLLKMLIRWSGRGWREGYSW